MKNFRDMIDFTQAKERAENLLAYAEQASDSRREERDKRKEERKSQPQKHVVRENIAKAKENPLVEKVSDGIGDVSDRAKKALKMDAQKELDSKLQNAIEKYNLAYSGMCDAGTKLWLNRELTLDLVEKVESLINSIANRPKEFDKEIAEIQTVREQFKNTCDYARQELDAAQKSAMGAGAGVAGGAAVACLMPGTAMWIATTFGTASTGTAISTLSGAAAESAALAWLGGGALAAEGGGMAMGEALLALAGPIGWSIAGATLLTSIVLFANSKNKLNRQKKEEIEQVLCNMEMVRESAERIKLILDETIALRESVNAQYQKCMGLFGKNFLEISEEHQMNLGTLVNESKALAYLLGKEVEQ
ncbi:MAG: hypothetical protein LUE92_16420 [Clostridiales bacterium]|nr:hypothetical protein [Clostridiales bacterium]